MKYIIIPFLLLAFFTAAFSQCTNPLLKSSTNPDGVPGLSAPQVVSGLKSCPSLEGKSSCCSADTINSFKTTLSATMDQIKARAGDGDKKAAKVMYGLSKVMNKSLDIINKFSSIGGGRLRILQLNPDLGGNVTQMMKEGFNSLIKSRASCFTHSLQIASKLLCMACMTDTSAFIQDGKLKISNKTCGNLLAKCTPFMQTLPHIAKFKTAEVDSVVATQESALNSLSQLYDQIKGFQSKKNDPAAAMELLKKIGEAAKPLQDLQSLNNRTIANLQNPVLPPGCGETASNCTLLCDRIISDKGLNFTALETGGLDYVNIKNAPIFDDKRRMLVVTNDGFDVETQVSSGFESSLSFPENPSNANPETGEGTSTSFSKTLEILVVLLSLFVIIL